MKSVYSLFVSMFTLCFIFSASVSNFSVVEKEIGKAYISFTNEELVKSSKDGYDYITKDKNSTIDDGFPSLPSYSFSYGIDPSKEYSIKLNVLSSHIVKELNIYPYQSPQQEIRNTLSINNSFYNSDLSYPDSNIFYNRSVIRGNEILTVNIIPFSFTPSSGELLIYDELEIVIEELSERENYSPIQKRSRVFQKIYSGMVLDTFDSREIDFQDPSILYICDNNVGTNNIAFNNLLEWRRRQGYEVNVYNLPQNTNNTNSVENYINTAYATWENPPEFICLVGDADSNSQYRVPTHTVGEGGNWGANAESDLPYVLLEGNDFLADITIGRISVRSDDELTAVASKIVGYEKLYAGTDWLESVALVGDPADSGISTIITNEYIAMIMDNYGIQDINEQYGGSGNQYETFMRNQINAGVSYLNYRGFFGFSGFDSQTVSQLSNGYRLPFLTTLTCDTGSFLTDQSSICETLVKAGTASNPKGAVAVVATAQPYTHTAFNNIVTMGMYSGIFLYGAQTAGEALTYGQLAINNAYPQNPNNNSYYFSAWNNLMGDPATMLWTGTPRNLIADHLSSVSSSDDVFDVLILDQSGNPVQGANINITNGSNIYINSITGADGHAYLPLENSMSGQFSVTATCQDCYYSESSFNINNLMMPQVINSSVTILDPDGMVSPGETVNINFDIYNPTSTSFNDLDILVYSSNPGVISNIYNLPSIGIDQTENVALEISVPSDILPDTEPLFYIQISGDQNSYQLLDIDVMSGSTTLNPLNISGAGQISSTQIRLDNTGELSFTDLSGEIMYNGGQLIFSNLELSWSSVNQGSVSNSNFIDITVSEYTINGKVFNIPVLISSENTSYEQVVNLQITAGNVSVSDPVGPDSYGYYIYDMTDTDYDLAPVYDWIEISNTGTYLNQLNDGGDNQDKSTTLQLPFTFTFYGVDYSEITICSNGWISFGRSDMESFRNYPIPGTGGPSPMVAVFWDDLEDGQIYYLYDSDNDRVIIQWEDQELFYDNFYENTFQVILYNTDVDVMSGDDEILIQYKEFNNESLGAYPVGNYQGPVIHGQYASVGIEDHTGLIGLEYTFNDDYAPAAATLYDNSAIFITTRDNSIYLIGDVNQDSGINILDVILTVNIVLNNDGAMDYITSYQQYVSDINQDGIINILDIILLIELILNL